MLKNETQNRIDFRIEGLYLFHQAFKSYCNLIQFCLLQGYWTRDHISNPVPRYTQELLDAVKPLTSNTASVTLLYESAGGIALPAMGIGKPHPEHYKSSIIVLSNEPFRSTPQIGITIPEGVFCASCRGCTNPRWVRGDLEGMSVISRHGHLIPVILFPKDLAIEWLSPLSQILLYRSAQLSTILDLDAQLPIASQKRLFIPGHIEIDLEWHFMAHPVFGVMKP